MIHENKQKCVLPIFTIKMADAILISEEKSVIICMCKNNFA